MSVLTGLPAKVLAEEKSINVAAPQRSETTAGASREARMEDGKWQMEESRMSPSPGRFGGPGAADIVSHGGIDLAEWDEVLAGRRVNSSGVVL